MNGCISTNLEVVPTDSPHLIVYSGLRLCARSRDENGSWVECLQLCIDSNVKFRTVAIKFICEAHVMIARLMYAR